MEITWNDSSTVVGSNEKLAKHNLQVKAGSAWSILKLVCSEMKWAILAIIAPLYQQINHAMGF